MSSRFRKLKEWLCQSQRVQSTRHLYPLHTTQPCLASPPHPLLLSRNLIFTPPPSHHSLRPSLVLSLIMKIPPYTLTSARFQLVLRGPSFQTHTPAHLSPQRQIINFKLIRAISSDGSGPLV